MRHSIFLLAVAALLLAGCSKEKKTVRQLEGTWDITTFKQWESYTGECGTPASDFNEFETPNAGTFEFSKNPGQWLSETDMDAQSGTLTMSYTFISPITGNPFAENVNLEFDWFIVDEKLIIQNPDEFVHRTFNLDDFDKKAFDLIYGVGDGLGCQASWFQYSVEKQ